MTMTLPPPHARTASTARPRRVNVIGTCGAGKTTLARELGRRLSVPHVELDGFRHGPNWTETPDPQFREMVHHALSGDGWTVDGNYGIARDLIWSRAQTVVWLDYSFPLVMTRLLRRTVRRMATQEELWNGNRESFRLSFMSRDSILLWGLRTYHRKRREIPRLFQQPEYAHLELVTLRSPAEAARWLHRAAPFR